MCLIVFAYKAHPKYDLILAANRDEQYKRPTRPAQFWEDHPDVLAGKDLSAGGTWMGINRTGSFAALTNYRDPDISKEDPPSRGGIVLDYLTNGQEPASFLGKLDEGSDRYMGFNILAGTPDKVFHYSNQEKKVNKVAPGVHALSNHLLDTPWPKVEKVKVDLSAMISQNTISTEKLFGILQDDQPFPDNQLPDTGIPTELEKKVSPIFINTEKYGTRSSSVLLIEKGGQVTFEERRYQPHTTDVDETSRYKFEVEQASD